MHVYVPNITFENEMYTNEYKLYETFICLLEYNKFIYWNFPRALFVAESLLRITLFYVFDFYFKDLVLLTWSLTLPFKLLVIIVLLFSIFIGEHGLKYFCNMIM